MAKRDFNAAFSSVTRDAIRRLEGKRQEDAARGPEPPEVAEASGKKTRNKPTKKGGRIAFRISEDLQRDFETLAHASEKTTTAYLTDLIEREIRENAAVISGFRRIQEARETLAEAGKE